MSTHALFSPSAAPRWMACPGSFAYPGNTEDGESSTYADDGTASHYWAAEALKNRVPASHFIGEAYTLNGKTYAMDEQRAEYIQQYIDTVLQASEGMLRFVEHWVDTSEWLGEGQGGTADFAALSPEILKVADLKYGMGEKVDAFYVKDGKVMPNEQLGLYAAGLLVDARLLGYSPTHATLTVCQPRLGHTSSETFPIEEIVALAERAKAAAYLCGQAMVGTPAQAQIAGLMYPGTKQCRWCRAKSECPALAKFVADEVREDFQMIGHQETVIVQADLGQAMRRVPLIEQWCEAVRSAVFVKVTNGEQIIGEDGEPMKLVEGKMGNRKWTDAKAVEATLVGLLGPKAYEPQALITAPAAAKILDKKKTEATWAVLEPYITRSPGKPVLALGSDTRAPYTGNASEDFEVIE